MIVTSNVVDTKKKCYEFNFYNQNKYNFKFITFCFVINLAKIKLYFFNNEIK